MTAKMFENKDFFFLLYIAQMLYLSHVGAQWLNGRVLDSRPRGRGFEPHRRHCVVSLSKNINPSLALVQPRKTGPFITERLLMGREESNQTNKQKIYLMLINGKMPTIVGILSFISMINLMFS